MRKMSKVFVWSVAVLFFCAAPVLAQDFTHPTTGTSNFSVTGTHNYYDSGGADCDSAGEYAASETGIAVICPATTGEFVTIEFLDVDVESSASNGCYDYVTIYDGNSTAATQLIHGCGEEGFASCSEFPGDGGDCAGVEGGSCDINGTNFATPANNIFTSTDATGCLTVEFTSDTSVHEGGWVATVTAAVPVELMSFSVE
jgi:hypothetical protein